MKKITKLFALILSLIMLVGCFAGCGETPSLSAAYDKYISQYKTNEAPNGTLKVALSPDFAPMEFYDVAKTGNDAIVGFDVILANYLAKELGKELVLKPMSFDACQAAAQAGTVDIAISGFSWTADRAENYEITDYYVAGDNETEQVLITSKANEGKFTTVESLKGMKIGYQGASLQELLVNEQLGEVKAEGNYVYSDLGTAAEALKTGKIDCLAVAKGNGEAIIANAPEQIALAGFDFDVDPKYENNVCLIQKGNTELLNAVNAALAKAMEADLYTGWYEACEIYSGIETADELGYDDAGNKITE
ncbi:MAG: transporter substrate-binding domain-containing protein [Clostridia bacterium]|nr:transporter substrate-binding domain-containing protein [Clostridia bacterium]